MKLGEGKYYRTRDGRKVGPMEIWFDGVTHPFTEKGKSYHYSMRGDLWKEDGTSDYVSPKGFLVAEWKEEPMNTSEDTPVLWKDMTPEEKGALLLANHEGETIEFWCVDRWEAFRLHSPSWIQSNAYRVKPEEPKRETVDLYGADFGKEGTRRWNFSEAGHIGPDTHKITFDTIDGKIDRNSITIEELD